MQNDASVVITAFVLLKKRLNPKTQKNSYCILAGASIIWRRSYRLYADHVSIHLSMHQKVSTFSLTGADE